MADSKPEQFKAAKTFAQWAKVIAVKADYFTEDCLDALKEKDRAEGFDGPIELGGKEGAEIRKRAAVRAAKRAAEQSFANAAE